MRRLAVASLVLASQAGATGLMYFSCPGCIERHRVNAACEWDGDAAYPLDLERSSHRQHLSHDAQLAEDLAIRYADAEYRRRSGYEGHGGLIANGEFRNECMRRLVAAITNNHRVAIEDVRVARGQRNAMFDAGVALLFLPAYLLIAAGCCVALCGRFSADPSSVLVASVAVSSLAVSFIGVQLLELWLAVWEAIRVGNQHLSTFRAATWNRWSQTHHLAEFVAGVALFWVVASVTALHDGRR